MVDWVLAFRVDRPELLPWCAAIAVVFAVVLLVRRGGLRSRLIPVLSALLGAAIGYGLCWLFGDVLDVVGVALTPTTRAWVAVATAGVALAIASMVHARPWRVVVAAIAIPVFVLVGAIGVNVDVGEFPTVRSALGIDPYPALTPLAAASGSVADWKAPADLPSTGTVERVDIPATTSGFAHRPALVYLPPAARTANPPRLPVIEAFSGQPGEPADLFQSGGLATLLNRYAQAHDGVAPIVVVPDQLGAPERNPMCVDGPLGNSASYLTVDVPKWINANLPVSSSREDWFVAGFSQGGTCAIQLGAGHPELFGGILDISGEVMPSIGADTVALGFKGSDAAYQRASPVSIMASRAPYADTVAIFGYGSDDSRYGPQVRQIEAAAASAGMRTTTFVSEGTAHDWHTVHHVFSEALPVMADRFGIR